MCRRSRRSGCPLTIGPTSFRWALSCSRCSPAVLRLRSGRRARPSCESLMERRQPRAASTATFSPSSTPSSCAALAKQPNDRHQSAVALAAELRSVAAILDIRAGEREPPGLIQARPPTGRRWPARLASVVVLVLLAGAAGWTWQHEARRLWRRWFGPAISPVIAVVPLDAADTGRDYFASGLTDDLITRLGQIHGLKVVGRSSLREYRGMDLQTIARQLDAGVLLTGWVRPTGGQIHLRVELVEP